MRPKIAIIILIIAAIASVLFLTALYFSQKQKLESLKPATDFNSKSTQDEEIEKKEFIKRREDDLTNEEKIEALQEIRAQKEALDTRTEEEMVQENIEKTTALREIRAQKEAADTRTEEEKEQDNIEKINRLLELRNK